MPSYEISGYPENTTCKQFLGYMLGLMGKNGMISPDDKLVAYWYTDSDFNIDYDIQYMNGFNRTTDEDITINSLTSGSEDNVLVSGSGFGITFENPYMTQDILDDICENICPFTYTPCNVSWRGNPALQISDIVKVEDKQGNYYNVLLNEHTLLLTGMNSSIVCKGETEIDAVMSQSPTDIKLNKLYGTLTDAFKNTTDRILGNQGGYYKVDMNEEGFPSGWTIMNTPELTDSTHLWKFTSGGLGYSEDGGKTFTNIAFDLEGNFSANAITTGVLQGEMFELNLMTGVIKIGKRDDNGEISNPSFYLNEKGELTIQAFDEIKDELKVKKYTVAIENTGTELFMATDTVTLSAILFADNEDVTDDQIDVQFQWYKNNTAFKIGKSIIVTPNDVDVYANIYCAITLGDVIKNTQTVTITDNNDIANLGNSFLDTNTSLVQTLDGETYFPDWTVNNAVITPAIINGVVNVDLNECEITYKRVVNNTESNLISGETVSDGILAVNKNILTKESPSITYVCYVTYKNSEIKLYASFYLNVVAQDGQDGSNGENGISVTNVITYFALSSSDTQEPAGGWITTKPTRSEGQWLWRKDVTKLSDGTEITTPAYVVTGDKGDTGPQGGQGIPGPKGDDGISSYFYVRYSQNANGNPMTESAVGALYMGVCVTTSSDAPASYTEYKWTKIKGDQGEQGIQGPNGSNGKSSYLHVKYSDNGTSFTANGGETPGKYIGTYVDFNQTDSTTFSDYTWVKIEGPQGVQGPKGDDGVQYYTWLKYADTPTSGMSDDPAGKDYIGLAYNKTTPTESSNYSDYTWSKIKGEKGDQGIQGPSGDDGQTLYTWVKYATSASGANMSDDPTNKTYIGLAYNKTTATESNNANDYTWSLIKGDKGDTGATGPAGKGVQGTPAITYQAGTSGTTPPTGNWVSSIPSVPAGQYLWSRTIITYTDNSTSTIYSVARNGNDGKDGQDGADGKSIDKTTITYQASNSGTTVPSGAWTSSIPATTAGQYLWTRTVISYSDDTTSTSYSVGRNGTNGADAAVMSDTAPDDKNKLWYDTANDLLKYWNGETWEVVNDYAGDLNDMKQQITTEYNSAINQLKNSLTTLVEEISTTSTANTEAINNLSSQIAQNATSITMATTSIQQITDKITGLTTKEEISQWARFENGILELGSSDSPFAVKLSQTELGFYQNGTRIAYLSNQQLNISQAVVMQQINLGPYQIVYDEDYGLLIR